LIYLKGFGAGACDHHEVIDLGLGVAMQTACQQRGDDSSAKFTNILR
jgi:hypothetical protein